MSKVGGKAFDFKLFTKVMAYAPATDAPGLLGLLEALDLLGGSCR